MHWLFKITSFLVFVVPAVALAMDCDNAKTQQDINQCTYAEFQELDQRLNKAYAEYRSLLSANQKRQLRDAQRAWINFRDFSCEFEGSGVEGGSIHSYVVSSCLAEKTRDRLKDITRLSNCKEGDLCPTSK